MLLPLKLESFVVHPRGTRLALILLRIYRKSVSSLQTIFSPGVSPPGTRVLPTNSHERNKYVA